MSAAAPLTPGAPSSGNPKLVVSSDGTAHAVEILNLPFHIGRKPENDLCLPHPAVSRVHAQIVYEEGAYYLEDLGSKLGTLINNQPVMRQRLRSGDRLQFGSAAAGTIVFSVHEEHDTSEAQQDLSGLAATVGAPATDIERLSLFLQAASRLNTTNLVEDILGTLVDATLRLVHAERGFVFLKQPDGTLRLASGLDSRGTILHGDQTISHSILQRAASSGVEFLVTDTSADSDFSAQMSIVAFDLRTVVAIPLLQTHTTNASEAVLGVLYLDSKHASRDLSSVSNDLLRNIAHQAAALIENARLVQEREAKRRYEQELAISANIQQRLMNVSIPHLSFASVCATSTACRDIGGDFFDVVESGGQLSCVVTDVCGKGVSAALLASILQGMIYAQLRSGLPLADIVSVANEFLCERQLDAKYATLTIARVDETGALEIVNCGHIPPFILHGGKLLRCPPVNPPVGLLPGIKYAVERLQLEPQDRLIIVTDGITEASNAGDVEFGDQRVESALQENKTIEAIIQEMHSFCGAVAQADDCTILELRFRPAAA